MILSYVLLFIITFNRYSLAKSALSPFDLNSSKKANASQTLLEYNDEKVFNLRTASPVKHHSKVGTEVTEFVAKVKGDLKQARKIAQKFNLKLVKRVFEDSNYFLFQQDHTLTNEKLHLSQKFNDAINNEASGFNDDETEIDHSKNGVNKRSKRLNARSNKSPYNSNRKRLRRSLDVGELTLLKKDSTIEWVQQQIPKTRVKRDYVKGEDANDYESNENIKFNDPMWSKLWYINSNPNDPKFSNSMRIKEAWKKGYTGKGVVVTILDDGLEWDHPDLIKNYDYRASLDINDSDNDPKPRYDRYNYNKHGTRCAGEIAAVADNNVCSVGVAYNSRIGGIRMLDGEVTDLVEATALSFNRDYIDIYSASWGPDDDGKTVDGPGFLALKAIEDGIKYGRRGLGSIYVWASGNGGKDDDNCNCDGYTNSIYTISISSATQNGNIPWYSEACSSTIASTFSSGSYEEHQIITTDLRKSCTEAHTGTSASAPLAAGIIALTLEANPELSWRDIQHIIVETSKSANLTSSDWQLNGANRRVSHSFGYGMMDAVAMIDLAKTWISVPNQRKCIIETSVNGHYQKPILIPKGDRLIIELYSSGCKGTKNEINYLEHVQAVISVQSNSRGTLVVYLRSPMGTNSTLLDRRMLDQSTESFNKWPFTSVHMWGEIAQGVWTIEIHNNAKNTTYLNLNLILYGTKESPQKRAVPDTQQADELNQNAASWQNYLNQEQPAEGSINDSLKFDAPSIKLMSAKSSSTTSVLNLYHDQRNQKQKHQSASSSSLSKIYGEQHTYFYSTSTKNTNNADNSNSIYSDKLSANNDEEKYSNKNDNFYDYKAYKAKQKMPAPTTMANNKFKATDKSYAYLKAKKFDDYFDNDDDEDHDVHEDENDEYTNKDDTNSNEKTVAHHNQDEHEADEEHSIVSLNKMKSNVYQESDETATRSNLSASAHHEFSHERSSNDMEYVSLLRSSASSSIYHSNIFLFILLNSIFLYLNFYY